MADTRFESLRRPFVLIALMVTLAATAVAGWAVFALLQPTPPKTVAMSTGPEGGAYAGFGELYREILGREGIELRLFASGGAVENLARLRDARSGISMGFAAGGTTSLQESPDLVSLGTVFYEPLWLFHRGAALPLRLDGLRGKRISIGPEGSSTRSLTLELLARNGVDPSLAELLPYAPQTAGEKLLAGEIEAAIMLTSWDSPVVRRLLATDGVQLASYPRADAYVALYPFLSKLILPAGTGDLAKNRPPTDVVLLASKASLVVRTDLHPAIQYLLLDAASKVHGGPGIFQKAGQFPAAEAIDLPLSESARQFYKSGPPFLQRYLPFWMAVLAGQALVLLIPVIGLLYPLLRILPGIYGWAIRRRIFGLYEELKALEIDLEQRRPEDGAEDLIARLDRLDERANQFSVPTGFLHLLYTLRFHMTLVRARLEKR